MAVGFVIGAAESTATNPVTYWDGDSFTADLDNAAFYAGIEDARVIAGGLQVTYASDHVEAYSVTKTVAHTPPLPPPTDTGAEGI